jgi:signal transduction histidine kinase
MPRRPARTRARVWSTGSAHLLVVAASPESIAELHDILAPAGYTVHGVAGGPEAVRRAQYIYYQVIVLVHPLGEAPLATIVADLHGLSPESEILVVAGAGFLEERVERPLLGVISYLARPVEPDRLLLLVAQAVERQRLRRRLAALSDVAYAVGQLLDLPRVLEVGLDKTLEVMGQSLGAVYSLREADATLELQVARGFSPAFLEAAHRVNVVGDVHEQALVAMQAVYLEDLHKVRGSPFARRLQREGAHAAVIVPLRMLDQGLGTLVLGGRSAGAFHADELRLLVSIGQHLGVAVAHARLHERERLAREQLTELLLMLQEQAAELRSLSGRVVRAQEAERRHIARELHDGIGQVLTALRIDLGLIADMLPGTPDKAAARLAESRAQVGDLMNDVRRISAELRPSMLDDLGLLPTLNWLAGGFTRRLGIPVTFEAGHWPEHADPDLEIGLFRIVQEAVNNAVKHAGAHRIDVRLAVRDGDALLEVADDGLGFDVEHALHGPGGTLGSGLRGMRERVVQLGGEMRIESEPAKGTRLHVQIPLESH